MEKSPESSPEFEFWMVSNPPSFPQPQELLTPDELFADGVILPLIHPNPNPNPGPDPSSPPDHDSSLPPPPPAKKWKHIIFKPRQRKERSKAAPPSGSSSALSSAAAELNINIWPFSRSRSAGNAGPAARGRATSSGRRACSAPCSRSNSRGEGPAAAAGGGRRWGPPGGGVHVGRSGPVWQLKRGGSGNGNGKKSGGGMHVLNLKNVNTCIGYGSQVRSCRGEDKEEEEVTGGDRTAEDGGGKGSLFSIRAMFSKKVH